MLDQLLQLDQRIFTAINDGLSNPFFDWLMPLLRNRYFWSPLYLFLVVFFVRNYKRKGWALVLFFLITFALADYFSAGILKHLFERLRPCNDPSLKAQINSLVVCGSGFSFPSTHATNHFALGMFLITVFYKRWKWIVPLGLLWGFSIAFAQVYVGVHFPLDVTTGAILGCIIGYVTGTIFLTLNPDRKWNSGS
jgi:undecaprenyl-diphosphatase